MLADKNADKYGFKLNTGILAWASLSRLQNKRREMYSQAQSHLGKSKRKEQSRTRVARSKMITTAIPMFAEKGFDATSISDIEVAAGVKRGMLVYHFKSKKKFWETAIDSLFTEPYQEKDYPASMNPTREGVAIIIRLNVRIAAQYPEIGRLVTLEARQNSWRLTYIVDKHITPGFNYLKEYVSTALNLTTSEFAHWYYIMAKSCSTIFVSEPECSLLFGFDSLQPEVVETHADMLVKIILIGEDK